MLSSHMMVKSCLLAVVMVTAAAAGPASGVDSTTVRRPDFSDYALESAGALGCGCGASLLPIAATIALMEGGYEIPGIALGCVGLGIYAVGSAGAVRWAGNRLGWSGNYRRSLTYAAIPAACGVLFLVDRMNGVGSLGALVCVFGTPIMAAVGFNKDATRREPQTSWEQRLAPPSLSARVERPRERDRRQSVTYDAKLLTVRF